MNQYKRKYDCDYVSDKRYKSENSELTQLILEIKKLTNRIEYLEKVIVEQNKILNIDTHVFKNSPPSYIS